MGVGLSGESILTAESIAESIPSPPAESTPSPPAGTECSYSPQTTHDTDGELLTQVLCEGELSDSGCTWTPAVEASCTGDTSDVPTCTGTATGDDAGKACDLDASTEIEIRKLKNICQLRHMIFYDIRVFLFGVRNLGFSKTVFEDNLSPSSDNIFQYP